MEKIVTQEQAQRTEEAQRTYEKIQAEGLVPGMVIGTTEGMTSVVSSIKGADKIKVWDNRTGQESDILYYMLTAQLKKKREDGSFAFTTTKPTFSPPEGIFKCLLHAEDPNRARHYELGYVLCPKGNLRDAFQVRRHMQKRHPAEWKAIEEERLEKERQEDRALQRLILEKMAKSEEAPLYVSKKDQEK